MALSEKDRHGLMLIGVAGAFAMALFAAKVFIQPTEKPLDDCASHQTRSTIVLLDYSEPISSQTRDEIESRVLSWVADSVAIGERVSVFAVQAEATTALAPRFSRCRPPETGNRIVENVARIRRHFVELFRTPLQRVLSQPPGSSNESPLAQVIIDLSLSHYMQADTTALLVFSDLMENRPAFSLYGCSTPDATVQRFRASRTGMQERPKFTNLRAMLHVVPRTRLSRATLACRDRLWLWFFGDNSGGAARVEPSFLPGGASR